MFPGLSAKQIPDDSDRHDCAFLHQVHLPVDCVFQQAGIHRELFIGPTPADATGTAILSIKPAVPG